MKLQPSGSDNQTNRDYALLAEIEYHTMGLFSEDSRIKIGNSNLAVGEVLIEAYSKFWTTGFGERVFSGPDGKMYMWRMDYDKCRLYLQEPEAPIATFHREHLGILSDAQAASLEIFPQGEHMVDDIVTTFVYMERLRTEKARRRRN